MDYKYIEQLLERYWECTATPEEERLLRDFYLQSNLPAHLEKYRALFDYEREAGDISLGKNFDEKILSQIGENVVKARHNSLNFRLRPFYRATAMIAIIFTLGIATQHSFSTYQDSPDDTFNYASYKDTYTDPQVAYKQVASALREVSDGLRDAGLQTGDSVKLKKLP